MMPALICCILIVTVGTLDSSFTASRAGRESTWYRAVVQEKKDTKDKRPTPEAIWKGIKSAAQNEVSSNSSSITAPRFTLKQMGSSWQFTIVKGDVSGLGFRDDPYELPFKKQILIEALRLSLTETDLSVAKTAVATGSSRQDFQMMSASKSYLDRAENLVRKTVVDIESEPDKNLLREKLRESERQIDELLYDNVYQAVEQIAKRNDYNIIYGRGGGDIKKFSVNIITVPDGAKVMMMTDLVYRKQLILKTDRSQWPWIEIVQNPYQLLGRYRYLTVWPDGKRAEGSIDVANASPLRLLPN